MIPCRIFIAYIGSLLQDTTVFLEMDVLSRARMENQSGVHGNGFTVNCAQSSQTSSSKSFAAI